jgi:hypothetical protein
MLTITASAMPWAVHQMMGILTVRRVALPDSLLFPTHRGIFLLRLHARGMVNLWFFKVRCPRLYTRILRRKPHPRAGCCGGWGLDTPGYPIIALGF